MEIQLTTTFLKPFLTVVFVTLMCQILKAYLDLRSGKQVGIFNSGGMPSVHTAAVTALTLVVLFEDGLSLFFLAVLVLACIIIYDSTHVRYEVSKHSEALNELLKTQAYKRMGHTPLEVFAGFLLGLLVTALVYLAF